MGTQNASTYSMPYHIHTKGEAKSPYIVNTLVAQVQIIVAKP